MQKHPEKTKWKLDVVINAADGYNEKKNNSKVWSKLGKKARCQNVD